ncbi:MAG: GNAT family N-acetyltransferase [Deltaproteobacteria bacterium]|nr:GNAT family N-acetyltransferase [Candidatus Zymogenaceae bacterium]
MNVSIAVFASGRESQIIELISSIQQNEYGIDITPDQQPDLKSIPAFYQAGSGNFWVALADNEVVGTIALKDIGNGMAALRKMFVAPAWRGDALGVARALLETLLAWARSKGLSTIYLGTTAQFLAAQRFYEKNGVRQVPKEALPASFPVMAVDSRFYIYELTD